MPGRTTAPGFFAGRDPCERRFIPCSRYLLTRRSPCIFPVINRETGVDCTRGVGGREAMSDMRLIVAGAGGRMGRTLIHAIAAMDGAILAGAVEAAGSAVIGRHDGELAGLGKNGVRVA